MSVDVRREASEDGLDRGERRLLVAPVHRIARGEHLVVAWRAGPRGSLQAARDSGNRAGREKTYEREGRETHGPVLRRPRGTAHGFLSCGSTVVGSDPTYAGAADRAGPGS